jgi:phage-related minor tail protein
VAGRIAGITIEIGGNTTKLQKALSGVDKQLRATQANLKDVNKLLKLNPGNTELLTQKQKNLTEAIQLTKDRLNQLKDAQSGVQKGSAEWDALQREIIETEGRLKGLQTEMRNFGSVTAQQIKVVGGKLQEAGGKIEDVGRKLSGISAGAAAIGGGLLKLGYSAVQSADDLNTLSKQTGISTDELQKMQYASDLVDVSLEDITGALRKMKPKMDENNETFKNLGVSVTNADGSLRSATDVFYDSIKALSGIQNETERDQIAMALFGKGADELAGIIDDGGEALKQYGDEAENLGLIMSGDTLDALNQTNDVIDQTKARLAGTAAQIGADVATVLGPALEKGAEWIGTITAKLRELTPEQTETILKIVGIVAAIGPVLVIGGKLIAGVGSLISVLGSVVGFLGGPLTIAIGAVIAIGVLLWKNWDTIKEKAISLWNGLKATFESIKSTITGVVQNVISKMQALWDKISTTFNNIKDKVKNVVDTIKGIFNTTISFPHIKLPHFNVSGGKVPWGLGGKGTPPSISINWYRKAYDNPIMFTSPTVLATPSGLKGFGDGSGAEIVMGLDKLRQLVGEQDQNRVTIGNVNINVNGAGKNAEQIARDLQNILNRKVVAYA